MNNPYEIIKLLEATPSRNDKKEIIMNEARANHLAFFVGCENALSSYITFGIKQIPESTKDGVGLKWNTFIDEIENLKKRYTTGNKAKFLVEKLMNEATQDEWNFWYRRILLKDLACGVQSATINDAVADIDPSLGILTFECQLADNKPVILEKLKGDFFIEDKYDGVRLLTLVHPNGEVIQYSRSGHVINNFSNIRDVMSKFSKVHRESYIYDGELTSKTFNDLMTKVHKKIEDVADIDVTDAKYTLFDIIPYEKFIDGEYHVPLNHRYYDLWNSYNLALLDCKQSQELIKTMTPISLSTDDHDFVQRVTSIYDSAVKNGYEGIMIKKKDSPYRTKRSTDWRKKKPFIEVTLPIVGFLEGTKSNRGKLGKFVCDGHDMGYHIKVNVGGALSKKQRDEFWQNRDSLLGQLIEVRADSISQNKNGTYSLRFSRFLRFRSVEDEQKI